MASRKYNTFIQHEQAHHEATKGGLRSDKYNEDKNGAKELQVFAKKGRRCYVDEERYYLWIELQSTGELDAVIHLIRQERAAGRYISPEDAVAQVRGLK